MTIERRTAPTTAPAPSRWGREDQPDVARERLLDAAGAVFAAKGVGAVTVSDVAAAAGCTRGTVHRLFGDRDGVRRAFVDREAGRLAGRVAVRMGAIDDPEVLLVGGVLAAVAEVRADPVLSAWFTPDAAAIAGRMAGQARTIAAVATGWVDALLALADRDGRLRPDVDPTVVADAAVRLILSLLALPGADADAERRLVTGLLVPAVLAGFGPEARSTTG